MTSIEIFRNWYRQECHSNKQMLEWLRSVPGENHQDERFVQAVGLAAHLASCRENWLDRIITAGANQVDWWPKDQDLDGLPDRYAAIEGKWISFLDEIEDETLDVDFDFYMGQKGMRWNVLGQTMQLVGHSFYHRGQISLLVEQLGGKTTDTDYLYWRYDQEPERWIQLSRS